MCVAGQNIRNILWTLVNDDYIPNAVWPPTLRKDNCNIKSKKSHQQNRTKIHETNNSWMLVNKQTCEEVSNEETN